MAEFLPSGQMPQLDEDEFVSDRVYKRLKHLVSPHVDSFDYFLQYGLDAAVEDLPPMEHTLGKELPFRIKVERVEVSAPSKREDLCDSLILTPRECRERHITYGGNMLATVAVTLFDVPSGDEEKKEEMEEDGSDDDDDESNSDSDSDNDKRKGRRRKRQTATSDQDKLAGAVEGTTFRLRVRLGDLPIMVQSSKCHLSSLEQHELVELKEEANECGGYFILNGIERVIRLLQVPRRNMATAIERGSFKNRGPTYSDRGVTMRCVRPDQSSVTMTLHYLNNGGATLKFVMLKQEFLLPVVLVAKALVDLSDKEFFDRVVAGDVQNTFLTTRLELLLRDASQYNLKTRNQCLAYFGALLRAYLPIDNRTSDVDAGRYLLHRFIFVHCSSNAEKVDVLFHMLRKLYTFAQANCAADNADALSNHEILLPGHLITMIVKEKLEEMLKAAKATLERECSLNKDRCLGEARTNSMKLFQKHLDRNGSSLGGKVVSFLSTGNVVSSTGLDLMQVSGYTIVAERLNMFRYMSHFQSVHRGQFFTTMKTTTVRKLLPESWGFLCPVHTPDGGPCGLLNHMAREASIVCFPTELRMPTTPRGYVRIEPWFPPSAEDDGEEDEQQHGRGGTHKKHSKKHGKKDKEDSRPWQLITPLDLKRILVALGMQPTATMSDGQAPFSSAHLPVLLDGVVLGSLESSLGANVVASIRRLKTTSCVLTQPGLSSPSVLDPTMEVAYFPMPAPDQRMGAAYPGLYLQTAAGRMLRPVLNLQTRKTEWIGPAEQVHMDIACLADDVRDETTHIELSPDAVLSHIAALTPFSDYNQSPRNMYQCQMGKQSMGTPAHAIKHRSDNKIYRIQNPQKPLVSTQAYREYGMNEYPQGTNAVVAVIAYTGYDMEDAMIINKSSFERGFGFGCVVKTMVVDLDEEEKRAASEGCRPALIFSNIKRPPLDDGAMAGEKFFDALDYDGMPSEGERLEKDMPVCCFVDTLTGECRAVKFKDAEGAFVETVRVLGQQGNSGASVSMGMLGSGSGLCRRVSVTFRYPRRPIIGDKFSSRHGQKGTLSVLWPQENMPFSECGMSPDVLINPHAFPSRMTIGMLVESMAGKAGALHGHYQDATPFSFHEGERVIDHMGEQLRAAGFHYYGSEPLYSGLSGELMHCDIFMGVVYYQRLRHMVADKSQVRATGAVVATTRQPVKGRKKHGGIRLGEMERDALLSHGAAFCVHDRLMKCSDSHVAYCCANCGGLLTVRALGPLAAQAKAKRSSLGAAAAGGSPASSSSAGAGAGAGAGSAVHGGAARLGQGNIRSVNFCSACESAEWVRPIHLPYVFRFLLNELAGMGIKVSLSLR